MTWTIRSFFVLRAFLNYFIVPCIKDLAHGGLDSGTIYKNIYEKDINLSICKKLQKVLEEEGAIVYLTRDGDYDLSANKTNSRKRSDLINRAKIINESKADIYISIHLNSLPSATWSGAQVFYDDINENNKKIADMMQKQLKEDLNTNREAKEINNILMNKKNKSSRNSYRSRIFI